MNNLGRRSPARCLIEKCDFFSLFLFVYDRMYGLASPMKRVTPRAVPQALRSRALDLSRRFKDQSVPPKVLDSG